MKTTRVLTCLALLALFVPAAARAESCVECHRKATPGIVLDWQSSKHAANGVDCARCHGESHTTAADGDKAGIPTPETCGLCHADRAAQFKRGKHAAAWAAMKAMPTLHWQPMALTEGMKGCGGCHKIGIKTVEEIRDLRAEGRGFGLASCDACHTRHSFLVAEARQPQACMTCHMGFDHPQWEMYSASKHGVRHALRQSGILPASTAAPTCQDCHMDGGNHEVRTAWGFLGVRLPLPEDARWAADRAVVLRALGVLDPAGKPTARLEVVKATDMVRLDQAAWQKERDTMLAICGRCHSPAYAKEQLARGDDMIREADHLLAEAIRIIAALYQDGMLEKPKDYPYPFPDLLTFHDAPTVIEQKLFVMYLEHRMRAFQGAFHSNPDYTLWYGWSEMRRDLTEIKALDAELRNGHRPRKATPR